MLVSTSKELAKMQIGALDEDFYRFTNTKIKQVYRIVLEKDEDGRVVARCPDLQGVVTDGANEDEAIENAFDAVRTMLEVLKMDKDFILTITHKPRA